MHELTERASTSTESKTETGKKKKTAHSPLLPDQCRLRGLPRTSCSIEPSYRPGCYHAHTLRNHRWR